MAHAHCRAPPQGCECSAWLQCPRRLGEVGFVIELMAEGRLEASRWLLRLAASPPLPQLTWRRCARCCTSLVDVWHLGRGWWAGLYKVGRHLGAEAPWLGGLARHEDQGQAQRVWLQLERRGQLPTIRPHVLGRRAVDSELGGALSVGVDGGVGDRPRRLQLVDLDLAHGEPLAVGLDDGALHALLLDGIDGPRLEGHVARRVHRDDKGMRRTHRVQGVVVAGRQQHLAIAVARVVDVAPRGLESLEELGCAHAATKAREADGRVGGRVRRLGLGARCGWVLIEADAGGRREGAGLSGRPQVRCAEHAVHVEVVRKARHLERVPRAHRQIRSSAGDGGRREQLGRRRVGVLWWTA